MNMNERFQEEWARFEAGEALEECMTRLSDEDAALLQMAASLRSINAPARAEEHIAAQRANVLVAATQAMRRVDHDRNGNMRIPAARVWLDAWRALPRPAMYAAASIALVAVVLFGIAVLGPAGPTAVEVQPPSEMAQVPPAVPDAPSFTQFIPIIRGVLTAPNPQSAMLSETRGLVEMQASNGTWQTARSGALLQAGQRIRTQALSGATLLFYDGSQTRLGASTEMSVDELNAHSDGPRQILLTQWKGDSDHDVAPSGYAASRYEVNTPEGSATAKGTQFHVAVDEEQGTRIAVTEGVVAATGANVTVIVNVGRVTTIPVGEAPLEPAFFVSGEGVVTQTGETWVIGGLEFLTDENTVIIGNPQVDDRVSVEGHLLSSGDRVADLIVLLEHAEPDAFAFTGEVEAIGDAEWTIAAHTVAVDEETNIDPDIAAGDLVRVQGVIESDGTLLAESIQLLENGFPFEFTGIVESIGEPWMISGVAITTDADTEIEDGIVEGDLVKVEGRIQEDGSWLAREIKLAEEFEHTFEFSGEVQSMEPWQVSGIAFETDEQTQVGDDIEVGSRVRVEGLVLEDGTWLAREITLLDDEAQRFEFIARVSAIDPWVIGGVSIATDEDTEIEEGIEVDDLVRVKGRVLEDGTLLAESIERVDEPVGCLDIVTVVVRIEGDTITLENGETIELPDDVEIDGELNLNAVIIIHICMDEDGEITVVTIVVIVQPAPPAPNPPSPPNAGSVTICHIPPGNPSNQHTITVGQGAVGGHLGHGDTLGPCGDNDDGGRKGKDKDDDD